MLTFLFLIVLLMVFGKLLWFAVKAAWGIAKILLTIVCLPLILIAVAASGFFYIAFFGLIVVGILSWITTAH